MNNHTRRHNTITIVAMMFLYAMISFVTNLAAPVGKIWGESLEGASNAELLGMLGNMMNFAAYLIMGIPAGKLLTKIGYKRTALIAVLFGLIGIFVQFLSGITPAEMGFYIYLLGAFVAGICVCMLNTVTNPLLNLLGGGGNKGNQLNLIGGTINSLVGSLTPMFVGALIGSNLKGKSIADVNLVLYIAKAVFAVLFIVLALTPLSEPQTTSKETRFERSPWAFRHFTLGAIAIFMYVGVEIGIPATIISYLKPMEGIGFEKASFVAGRYWLLMLVGRCIGSIIGGKVSSRSMVMVTSGTAIALMLAALFTGDIFWVTLPTIHSELPIAALLLVLCGLCTSVIWGCIFNMAVEGLGKYTASASGIFMTMVVGGGIVPLVQSTVADHFGCLVSYVVPIICMAYILFYALVGCKNVNKDIKID